MKRPPTRVGHAPEAGKQNVGDQSFALLRTLPYKRDYGAGRQTFRPVLKNSCGVNEEGYASGRSTEPQALKPSTGRAKTDDEDLCRERVQSHRRRSDEPQQRNLYFLGNRAGMPDGTQGRLVLDGFEDKMPAVIKALTIARQAGRCGRLPNAGFRICHTSDARPGG